MPLKSVKYSSERRVLRVEVPVVILDDTSDEQIRDRVAELSRYAILAEAAYGPMADIYVIAETQEDDKEQVIAGFTRDSLHEYGAHHAGLFDLMHEATIRVNGNLVSISVDFNELSRHERESLGETFPRRDRSPN
jgi:phage FluMu gp28-like protein